MALYQTAAERHLYAHPTAEDAIARRNQRALEDKMRAEKCRCFKPRYRSTNLKKRFCICGGMIE